ncbi:MAG: hypothetical protein ABIO63_02290 [Casimicrobiaceae bacterium]
MTNGNRSDAKDPYRDLPYLLKPTLVDRNQQEVDPSVKTIGRTRVRYNYPPAPPAAGFNPYFDLPPDEDNAAAPQRSGGTER